MLSINDYVVSRNDGIAQIIEINNSNYKIKLYDNDKVIELKEKDIIRKIISKEEMEDIIDRMPFIQTIKAINDKARLETYSSLLEEFDELEWIRIIKTVYLRKRDNKKVASEQKYEKIARKYLEQEIAILFDIPIKKVEKFIIDKMNEDW